MRNNKSFYRLAMPLVALICVSMLSGCVMLFSSRYQKVTINSATKDAKIEYPEKGMQKNIPDKKFDKFSYFQTVTFRKEGYKSTNYSFDLSKRSPARALAILDIFLPVLGWMYLPLDLMSPKGNMYVKNHTAPALLACENRKEDEKYILLNNAEIDVKGKDIIWHQFRGLDRYNSGDFTDGDYVRRSSDYKDKENMVLDNSIFSSSLRKTLKKLNFIDTTRSIFSAAGNTLYLNATVKKIAISDVKNRLYKVNQGEVWEGNRLFSIELEIEWEVLDYYKQEIYSTKTTEKSDLITYNITEDEKKNFFNFLELSVADNLEYALIKITNELSQKRLLKKTSDTKQIEIPAITINKPNKLENGRLNDYMKSAVTIKVDEGHGSGAIISDDGYIITAYHVVVGSKKIEVIMGDGTKDTAVQVVRKNEDADLALLKISKSGLAALTISNIADPEIGVDVWAIGTPKSVELGQSVSKGVLSGIRKANNVTYLQTDVSLNGGNSGGPLVNKEGVILGVVTSKLIGVGTEGVGFAISAQEIMNKLKVQYKN